VRRTNDNSGTSTTPEQAAPAGLVSRAEGASKYCKLQDGASNRLERIELTLPAINAEDDER
jgi:hypothetical protein